MNFSISNQVWITLKFDPKSLQIECGIPKSLTHSNFVTIFYKTLEQRLNGFHLLFNH
jgi:hypothetical protein